MHRFATCQCLLAPLSRGGRVPRRRTGPWIIGAAIAIAATGAYVLRARAQTVAPPSNQRVSERLRALEREASSLAGQSRTLIGEIRKLEVERDLRVGQARQAEDAASAARQELVEVRRKLEALETQRRRACRRCRQQFVDLYKRGRRGELALLLSANGLREFARASRAAAALAFRRQRVIGDYERTLADLRAEREALTVKSRELRAEEARAETARRGAERAVAARAALLDDIDSRRDLTAQYLGELQQAYDRLGADMTARVSADAWSSRCRFRSGRFAAPWSGRSRAGWQDGSVSRAPRRAPCATASRSPRPSTRRVRAVHDGTVDYAEGYTGLGTLVILDHGANTYSLYGYLAEALVKRGDAGSGRRRSGTGRAGAGRGPADALLRAPRRRPFGRSRTMAEAPLTADTRGSREDRPGMKTRTRLWVLLVSTPVMAFALVGGYLGHAMAKDGTFQHLRVFEDVVSLVVNNYVEEVDVKEAMQGALKGLAEGLDPDSAYLTPDLVRAVEANNVAGPADVGVVLIRQYYLRVVSTRDGSPAARAGLAHRRLHPRHRRQADAQHVGLRGRTAPAGCAPAAA